MLSPRWRKMLRDTLQHKARTLLAVVAIAIGMTGAGALLDASTLLQRATAETWRASHPVSATLRTEHVDDALLAEVRAMPEVAAARARYTAYATATINGMHFNAELHALGDFNAQDIGRLRSTRGGWPSGDDDIAIEQSSLDFSGATFGESIQLALGKNPPRSMRIGGIAHDVSLPPGWMEHVVYGFVTPAAMTRLGATSSFNELQIVVRDGMAGREAVRRIAYRVKAIIERRGGHVTNIDVPVPGQHAHAAQMNSLMMTQAAFALLTLLVAGLLIVNLMTAQLSGQVREIGVMKTLGADAGQIGGMYLGYALLMGCLATAIAVPAAIAIGRPYAALNASMLNFSIDGFAIPWWALALQCVAGCLFPIAAAALPVVRGCRMPVGATLRDPGISTAGGGFHLRRRIAIPGFGRPLLLSIGNAFRRRERMLLTLLALAAGGAVYLGADNLRSSVGASVDLLFSSQHYDFVLTLADPHLAKRIETVAAADPGVSAAQAFAGESASVAHGGGMSGNRFTVLALPPATPLFTPAMSSGRWLRANDRNALVVSRNLLRDEPGLTPGTSTNLVIGGTQTHWTIVGIVDAGPQKVAYTPLSTFNAMHGTDQSSLLLVATKAHAPASNLATIARLRAAFEAAGMPVVNSQLLSDLRGSVEDHLRMVVAFLGVMGWVMIVIGGMGLASTMSLAVLERTREIGVMRAIGAGHRTILAMIQVEGLVIAMLGWLVSLPLSVPMSVALSNAFGKIMFTVPTHIVPDIGGMLRWLAMVVAVSIVSCAWSSHRAMRVPTAAALSYE